MFDVITYSTIVLGVSSKSNFTSMVMCCRNQIYFLSIFKSFEIMYHFVVSIGNVVLFWVHER